MFQLLLAVIYLSFISLGLPDSMLGSAWPLIYNDFTVPISYAGIISTIITLGTILSSLQSDKLTRKLGSGKVTAFSVALTALALFGFSISHSFWELCLWAIPYGLGAGSVDACLNNYVALHYESKHMSWLHCMWGVGASTGPYIMGLAVSHGMGWHMGYRIVSILQIILTSIILFSLPLWKKSTQISDQQDHSKSLSLKEVIAIKGAKEIMLVFFCYCALETTAGLWASSYLVFQKGISEEQATTFASLFYLGITFGRAISGFLTMKFNDTTMIRLGQGCILFGIFVLVFSPINTISLLGLIIIGLGCAPIYPCIIHSTPVRFGEDKSQAVIGIQMASAYVGSCVVPPLFGVLAASFTTSLFPFYLLTILLIMIGMHKVLIRKTN